MSNLYTIPPWRPFVDALADGLLARVDGDSAALADMLVLLPTRRACRSLREAFLRRSDGAAMLLPRMRPIGEVDEEELVLTAPEGEDAILADLLDLPPAISDIERLFHLTKLVRAYRGALSASVETLEIGPEQALMLARELARLLDQVQTEGLGLDRLEDLVPEKFAEYWAHTIRFLDILRTQWPAYLAANGKIDPAERRSRLMGAQVAAWQARPPTHPVIAAGSTGSIPAAARLIATVAELPQGMVVLPGLDRDLPADDWTEVRADPTHPQYGLSLLLEKLSATRAAILDWPEREAEETARRGRIRFLAEAMRPAKTTHLWARPDGVDETVMDGVEWIEAPSPASEAAVAAQCLREALDTPGRTAALVTPDRNIARRVAAQMTRWGIEIDDSAGVPLIQTAAGRFFMLTIEAAVAGLSPVALLAVFKQPLAGLGMAPADLRRAVRRLENPFLRGPRPARGAAGLRAAIQATDGARNDPGETARRQALETVGWIEAAFRPLGELATGAEIPFETLLRTHLIVAEALAATDAEPGAERLWRGEDGEGLAEFAADIAAHAGLAGPLRPAEYAPVLTELMKGRTVRPRYGTHPRLAILGPLEARLQHADRLVLAGLNEGTWPPEPAADPWMSKEMRADFGLPAHARRIGLAAHDFAQAFGAPDVVLVRAAKTGGQPTVPARWLERLETVLNRAGLPHLTPANRPTPRLAWEAGQYRADRLRLPRPEPRPPVESRPRKLSATRVETLMRDPYSIFARQILNLYKLDPLESDLGPAEKGTMIHKALEDFVRRYPGTLDGDAAVRALIDIGRDAFGKDALARPAVRAFWWPRFERIAQWFVPTEAGRRDTVSESFVEIGGSTEFSTAAGRFTLYAEADRIDRMTDGSYAILDYKTGTVPKQKEIRNLSAPQLVLEAAILRRGGFDSIPQGATVSRLAYWRLTGSDPAGEITEFTVFDAKDPDSLAEEIFEKLQRLVEAYDLVTTPYRPIPNPEEAPKYNDYAHLARIKEWGLADTGGGKS